MAGEPDDWEDGELDDAAIVGDNDQAEVEKAVFVQDRELLSQLCIPADDLDTELDASPAPPPIPFAVPLGTPTPAERSAMGIAGTPTTTGTNGVAYSSWTATSTGGYGPYTFTVASGGPLPTGITLNATSGLMSGTPSQTGTFANIVVRVTDVYGQQANLAPFTLIIS